MTIAPSICRALSTLRRAGSGSSTGKQLGEAAICPLSVEHFMSNLFYADAPPKVRESHKTPAFSPAKMSAVAAASGWHRAALPAAASLPQHFSIDARQELLQDGRRSAKRRRLLESDAKE